VNSAGVLDLKVSSPWDARRNRYPLDRNSKQNADEWPDNAGIFRAISGQFSTLAVAGETLFQTLEKAAGRPSAHVSSMLAAEDTGGIYRDFCVGTKQLAT
jgi:hypothetical protein